MCGWTSGLLLLYLAEGSDLEFKKIDYCNSGDSRYGNKDEVVGYNGIALFEKNPGSRKVKNLADEIVFTDKEKDQLISLARDNIRSLLYDKKRISVSKETLPDIFKTPLGAFVTLKDQGFPERLHRKVYLIRASLPGCFLNPRRIQPLMIPGSPSYKRRTAENRYRNNCSGSDERDKQY